MQKSLGLERNIVEIFAVTETRIWITHKQYSHKTQLTASDQLLLVYTGLPNATLILFELLTTAPVNALYYIEFSRT